MSPHPKESSTSLDASNVSQLPDLLAFPPAFTPPQSFVQQNPLTREHAQPTFTNACKNHAPGNQKEGGSQPWSQNTANIDSTGTAPTGTPLASTSATITAAIDHLTALAKHDRACHQKALEDIGRCCIRLRFEKARQDLISQEVRKEQLAMEDLVRTQESYQTLLDSMQLGAQQSAVVATSRALAASQLQGIVTEAGNCKTRIELLTARFEEKERLLDSIEAESVQRTADVVAIKKRWREAQFTARIGEIRDMVVIMEVPVMKCTESSL